MEIRAGWRDASFWNGGDGGGASESESSRHKEAKTPGRTKRPLCLGGFVASSDRRSWHLDSDAVQFFQIPLAVALDPTLQLPSRLLKLIAVEQPPPQRFEERPSPNVVCQLVISLVRRAFR